MAAPGLPAEVLIRGGVAALETMMLEVPLETLVAKLAAR
jgi:hypothetical protein